jgi:tetratricopeptide (TPR) repeat protein
MFNSEIELHNALNMHLQGDISKAESIYRQFLEKQPDNAFIYYLLANIFFRNEDYTRAQEYFKKAVELNSNIDFPQDLNRFEDIVFLVFMSITAKENIYRMENWEKALSLKPVMVSSYINVSASYLSHNDINNALRVCNEGLAQFPGNPDLLLNKSSALLKSNNIEQGWEFFESRMQIHPQHKLEFPQKPVYDGSQDINGKTIYVCTPVGYGDAVFFSRYLPLLAEKGAKVFVKPRKSLVSLFKENDLGAEIIYPENPEEIPEFDYQIPFMSLGNAFKTSLKTIPFPDGYLKANPQKSKKYKEKYFNNDKFKVGIYWQGSNNDQRSLSLNHLLPLIQTEGIQLYSLQCGNGTEQLENIPEIINLGPTFNDFSDTAGAIDNLDLVIGCDTSIANISGAMGKCAWVALVYSSDWKWGLFSEKINWYKSVKLFRQKEPNNWDEVIARICNTLQKERG